ncbi:GFA family protein [Kiloniella sp. b19]|uniref:GFA family protein n=1 Tax=Kiloniella sp. GXU_MW_B19 TaxID=3141326 RepID=UPI0031E38291
MSSGSDTPVEKKSLKGQCLCGSVRIEASECDAHYHACHCTMCQKWSGGPGLSVLAGNVVYQGEEHIRSYSSSDYAERGFCSNCGSNLFWRMKDGSMTLMSVGIFDDQTGLNLGGEIYIDHKPAGYDFAGDHSRMTEREFLISIGAIPAGA